MIFNTIKTVVLLAALSGLLLFLGSVIGGTTGIQIALFMSLLMNGISFFFADKIVLRMYGAKPLDKQEYGAIYETVEELTQKMHLPMPKLWLIHAPMANAFATGRGPSNGSIALTSSIITLLEPHELRGVLAHELSHIKNRDVLVSTIAATLASAIGYIAYMLRYAAFWGGYNRRSDRDSGGMGPFVTILIAIFMPIAASLIQLAISRSREYMADERGVHGSQDPLALASALEKLHGHIPEAHLDRKQDAHRAATASLFIVHPFAGNGWITLFMTHPPVHERVKRLRAMYEKRSSH